MSIRVVVHGALGKMGTQVIEAVSQAAGMVAVGAVDKFADSTTLTLDDGTALPLSQDLVSQLEGVDVVVDFVVVVIVIVSAINSSPALEEKSL